MRIEIIAVILLLAAQTAFASKDRYVRWSSVTIQAAKSERDLKVIVDSDKNELRSLVVILDGKKLAVPASEFKGINKIQLHSIQILGGGFTGDSEKDITPYQYVQLQFGVPYKKQTADYDTVDFMFYAGKYQYRTVRRQTGPGSWTHEKKLPGKQSEIEGEVTELK